MFVAMIQSVECEIQRKPEQVHGCAGQIFTQGRAKGPCLGSKNKYARHSFETETMGTEVYSTAQHERIFKVIRDLGFTWCEEGNFRAGDKICTVKIKPEDSFKITIVDPREGTRVLRKSPPVNGVSKFSLGSSLSTVSQEVFFKELEHLLNREVHYHTVYQNGQISHTYFTTRVPMRWIHAQILATLREDTARLKMRLHSAYYFEGGNKVKIL